MDLRFLVIEGNIGAGKTTLASMLSDDLNARLVLEQFADNPFLPKFYADQERYSFPLELSFLADRYNQIKKEVLQPELFRSLMISDYYFTKSAIFASNTLQTDEYRLFRRLFNIVFESLPKPDLYVYLYLSTDNLMRNIRKRQRLRTTDGPGLPRQDPIGLLRIFQASHPVSGPYHRHQPDRLRERSRTLPFIEEDHPGE